MTKKIAYCKNGFYAWNGEISLYKGEKNINFIYTITMFMAIFILCLLLIITIYILCLKLFY